MDDFLRVVSKVVFYYSRFGTRRVKRSIPTDSASWEFVYFFFGEVDVGQLLFLIPVVYITNPSNFVEFA